jgi:phosphate transport system substrate-binding protein
MIGAQLLALLGLVLATPANARDASWLIAPPALAGIAAGFAGPAARIEVKDDDEAAVTAYCTGLGAQTADGLLLHRRLLDRERRSCETEAISSEPERILGIVGLALDGSPAILSRRHLWRAFAREVSADGKLVRNRVRSWREVDPTLPDRPISLRVGAPVPMIEELIFAVGCLAASGYAKLERTRLCRGLRDDLPDGPNPIVLRLLDGTGDPIEGFAPTGPDLASGRYPLARRVYFYLKRPHLPGIPGMAELLRRDAPGLTPIP